MDECVCGYVYGCMEINNVCMNVMQLIFYAVEDMQKHTS
jgi:hypothetical protein